MKKSNKPDKHINIKFRGIDDWNRPVFKDVDSCIHYGSTNTLFTNETPEEINIYIRSNIKELEYFGGSFNCEPHGGIPSNYKLNIID